MLCCVVRWVICMNVLSHQLMFVLSEVYGNIVKISPSIRPFLKTLEHHRVQFYIWQKYVKVLLRRYYATVDMK